MGSMGDLLTNTRFIMIIVMSAIFLALSIYVYAYYISPKLNPDFVPNKEFIKESNSKDVAKLYLFYTEWCPHSKKALPIFRSVKEENNSKPINDTLVTFHEINGEEDEKDLIDFEKLHNVKIDGYPSIYLIKGDQVIEYDAETTEPTLKEFLNTTL
jgi:thiol-disulfide isomerase/thioredoxin